MIAARPLFAEFAHRAKCDTSGRKFMIDLENRLAAVITLIQHEMFGCNQGIWWPPSRLELCVRALVNFKWQKLTLELSPAFSGNLHKGHHSAAAILTARRPISVSPIASPLSHSPWRRSLRLAR